MKHSETSQVRRRKQIIVETSLQKEDKTMSEPYRFPKKGRGKGTTNIGNVNVAMEKEGDDTGGGTNIDDVRVDVNRGGGGGGTNIDDVRVDVNKGGGGGGGGTNIDDVRVDMNKGGGGGGTNIDDVRVDMHKGGGGGGGGDGGGGDGGGGGKGGGTNIGGVRVDINKGGGGGNGGGGTKQGGEDDKGKGNKGSLNIENIKVGMLKKDKTKDEDGKDDGGKGDDKGKGDKGKGGKTGGGKSGGGKGLIRSDSIKKVKKVPSIIARFLDEQCHIRMNCCGYDTDCWILGILVILLICSILAMIVIGATGFKHYLFNKSLIPTQCTYLSSSGLGERDCNHCNYGSCQASTFPCHKVMVTYTNDEGTPEEASFYPVVENYYLSHECSFYHCHGDKDIGEIRVQHEMYNFMSYLSHTEFDCLYSWDHRDVTIGRRPPSHTGPLAAMVVIGLFALLLLVGIIYLSLRCWWDNVQPS